MPAPNLGPAYDLALRLDRLEQQVRALASAQIGQAFSAKQSDGSVGLQIRQNVNGNGSLGTTWYQAPGTTARDPQTGYHPTLLYIGQVTVNGSPSTAAMLLYRSNGQQIAALGDGGFEWRELTGQLAVSTDQVAKEGLATPWVPLPTPQQTGVGNWPKTPGTGVVAQSSFHAQHPKVWWSAQAYCDTGTTGTVSLTLSSGSQSVSSATYQVGSGQFVSIAEVLTMPQPFMGQVWTAQVNGSVSSGTGLVYAQTYALYGRQS